MSLLTAEGIDLNEFIGVPYVASRHPGNVSADEFLGNPKAGSNCELMALGILRKAGFKFDDYSLRHLGGRFGAKELWLDIDYTEIVAEGDPPQDVLCEMFFNGELKAFDIYFFLPHNINNPRGNSQIEDCTLEKVHVGVWVGSVHGWADDCNPFRILHNPKPGPSALWSLQDFFDAKYSLMGIKRPMIRG